MHLSFFESLCSFYFVEHLCFLMLVMLKYVGFVIWFVRLWISVFYMVETAVFYMVETMDFGTIYSIC
jgi:hypothetical protein